MARGFKYQPDRRRRLVATKNASVWRRFATWLLEWSERLYLHAHGWDRRGEDATRYLPPDDYQFRCHDFYDRSHAVNAQKQLTYNPMFGGKIGVP